MTSRAGAVGIAAIGCHEVAGAGEKAEMGRPPKKVIVAVDQTGALGVEDDRGGQTTFDAVKGGEATELSTGETLGCGFSSSGRLRFALSAPDSRPRPEPLDVDKPTQ